MSDNVYEFKFAMPLNKAQENALQNELARLENANDGSDPMFHENWVVPSIRDMFFTFLKESETGLYDADVTLEDEDLKDKAEQN